MRARRVPLAVKVLVPLGVVALLVADALAGGSSSSGISPRSCFTSISVPMTSRRSLRTPSHTAVWTASSSSA